MSNDLDEFVGYAWETSGAGIDRTAVGAKGDVRVLVWCHRSGRDDTSPPLVTAQMSLGGRPVVSVSCPVRSCEIVGSDGSPSRFSMTPEAVDDAIESVKRALSEWIRVQRAALAPAGSVVVH